MKNKKLTLSQLKIDSFITSTGLRHLYGGKGVYGGSIEDPGSDSTCPQSESRQSDCHCTADGSGGGSGSGGSDNHTQHAN